jgi:hypothetical protein
LKLAGTPLKCARLATTNLAVASSQWTIIATNESDLAGVCAFTNPIPAGLASRFYRISLP